jgi:hypothetical protein
MLVTMTVASVAMSTAVTLVHRALRLEAASRRVLERERAALTLARQFRADIHRARDVACAGDALPAGVVLRATAAAAGTIDYKATPGGLVREESRDGRTLRETFASLPGTRWWAVREGRIVTLRADGAADAAAGPPPAVEVTAVMGGTAGAADAEVTP